MLPDRGPGGRVAAGGALLINKRMRGDKAMRSSAIIGWDEGIQRNEQDLPRPQPRQRHTRGINVHPAERWLSVVGGSALVLSGLKRRSLGGFALAVLGGDLIYRGVMGHCHVYDAFGISTASEATGAPQGIRVEKTTTIQRSPEEVYRFWRRFENLPRFMTHLEAVQTIDNGRSHWIARGPAGATVEWDAEITAERENELIAWRSLAGSQVANEGSVRFRGAPGGRGTEVHVTFTYDAPLGKLGRVVAKLFGEEPAQQAEEDLRRLKRMMEAGEIPTTEGQPSGGTAESAHELAPGRQSQFAARRQKDIVEEASEESFPASDAPAWTFRREGV
jgi:uncharacterized membrane protein